MTFERLLKFTAVITFALVLFGIANPALAQRVTPCNPVTPNNALCVTGTPPSTNMNGSPIVLALTYRLEQRLGTGAWTTVNTQAAPQFYVTNLAPGSYTFRMYAITNDGESDPSNTVTKDATSVPTRPNPPISVIAVVIGVDYSTVYTVLANGDRSNTVAGMAQVGTECEMPVLFRYRNRAYMKPVAWKREKGISTPLTALVAAPCA